MLRSMGAAERIIEVVSDLPLQDRLRLVVDAGEEEDPLDKLERIERRLAAGELPLDITRQVSGYWFALHEKTPGKLPTWLPTGALLPRTGHGLRDGGVLLVLVPIDYVWFPLSERGVYTYAHSSGLVRGEAWRFVPCDAQDTPWPTEYLARMAEPLAWEDVERLYGTEPARRARRDVASMQVQAQRRA
jgi:hypothetical protein